MRAGGLTNGARRTNNLQEFERVLLSICFASTLSSVWNHRNVANISRCQSKFSKDMIFGSSFWCWVAIIATAHEVHKRWCAIMQFYWIWDILNKCLLWGSKVEKKNNQIRNMMTLKQEVIKLCKRKQNLAIRTQRFHHSSVMNVLAFKPFIHGDAWNKQHYNRNSSPEKCHWHWNQINDSVSQFLKNNKS